jgi:hypothetical protein
MCEIIAGEYEQGSRVHLMRMIPQYGIARFLPETLCAVSVGDFERVWWAQDHPVGNCYGRTVCTHTEDTWFSSAYRCLVCRALFFVTKLEDLNHDCPGAKQ